VSRPVGPRIEPIGERALLVTLGDRVDRLVNARARRLAAALEALRQSDPRFGRSIQAATSVLVPFDPLEIDTAAVTTIVAGLADSVARDSRGVGAANGGDEALDRLPIEIGVRYGGRDGPDLAAVADVHGVTPERIVELHAETVWTALFLGYAPGFAYFGPLPPDLATPRRATPRQSVPAGSVAIGGDQTAVYPFSMPGGWHLIGRTSVRLWDLGRERPNLVQPGDRVRFVPAR
jgi:KipI family sensor histidine kinase inhibitor